MKAFFKSPSLVGRVGESPLLLLLLFFSPLSAQVVTFPVDKGLSLPPETVVYEWVDNKPVVVGKTRHLKKEGAEKVCTGLMFEYLGVSKKDSLQCYACSFEGDSLSLYNKDVMFQFFVKAYAEHRPIVLSPDMVWMLIGQGFSHYVNKNAEELRDKFVSHQGKKDLVLLAESDLRDPNADWEPVLNGFFDRLSESTKDSVTQFLLSDFSTTGKVERMASQMLIMGTMKSYFNYRAIKIACGIPSVTLEGTPADWQKVLDKTRRLKDYGLDWWVNDLTPILQEFVNASQGQANRRFWQNIVMKRTPKELSRGGGCGKHRTQPTMLDGWCLKFFPFSTEKDRTPEKVPLTYGYMLPELDRVPFTFQIVGAGPTQTYPMELWTGFVGIEEDLNTYALRPKIGWMVVEKK